MQKISIKTLLLFMVAFIMISLAIPLTIIVNKQVDEINLLRKEKIGVDIVSQLQTINMLLAQHRGIANRFLNGNKTVLIMLEELDSKLNTAFNAVGICCDSLKPSDNRISLIYSNWKNLEIAYQSMLPEDSFRKHSDLIYQIMAFQVDIADFSNLSLDAELSSYYLMNNMVRTLPNLMENMGQVRGFGSGLLVKKTINSSERIELTKLTHSVRLAMETVRFDLGKVFISLPVFEQKTNIELSHATHAIESFLLLTEREIISKSEVNLSDELFFGESMDVISETMQLYDAVVKQLNKELDKRTNKLMRDCYVIVVSFFLLFIITSAFIINIINRINKPLQHAMLCFEKISAEQYDYPIIINYQDEIGGLLQALQIMRNRLSDNVDQLKEMVNRLTQAQRIAKLGDLNWHIEENYWFFSEGLCHILEIDSSISQLDYDSFLSYVIVEDRNKVDIMIKKALASAGCYSIEYNIITSKGIKKVIFQTIESTENKYTQVNRVLSALQDVTAQREMESKVKLAAEVFNNVGEGIVVTDKNNKIVLINKAFTDITGFVAEEILGKNPNVLSSGKHDVKFYEKVWQDIYTDGLWRGEIWNRRKDDSIFPESLTITTIKNNNGDIINYIGIFFDISEQKKAHEKISYLAHYDSLTGLINRVTLKDNMDNALFDARQQQKKLAVLFIDLDGFKSINDYFGHDQGDVVLKITAERLKQNVRQEDVVARLGGDEFVVLLTNIREKSQITPIAEKLVRRLKQTFTDANLVLSVTPSIGIAVYPDDGLDYEQLLLHADKAMYQAKSKGRNQYAFFSQ